ncbi:Sec-independent protein translocase subunit TatA [Pseudonocardia sp. N23]|uniref:Sec-independent protein translocase subunit TatA n=1 Tax=Pseudonocardia sp. N23 TaxID=1987376 RepID=UPI000BFB83EE|nr:Sec-independent protein translocase subunit TatA [Pseudonocardia sp. N23]GAY11598.1 twin-arginine translocation protein TatA [Pseudonocardia sp. N23]
MGELSWWHWLIVIGVAVLLFGAKRLPDAARSLGRSTRILKAELRADDHPDTPADPAAAPAAAAPPATAPPAAAPSAADTPLAG